MFGQDPTGMWLATDEFGAVNNQGQLLTCPPTQSNTRITCHLHLNSGKSMTPFNRSSILSLILSTATAAVPIRIPQVTYPWIQIRRFSIH